MKTWVGHHSAEADFFARRIESRRFTFVVVDGGHCRIVGEGFGRIPGEEWEVVLGEWWDRRGTDEWVPAGRVLGGMDWPARRGLGRADCRGQARGNGLVRDGS